MQYVVTVKGVDATGQTIIKKRTVVYVDSELEAKVAGAEQLGVPQDTVVVTELGAVGLPDSVTPTRL